MLKWDKPEKIMTTEEWKKITADSAPPGVYTPNMSKEDMMAWKGKLIKGASPRVEIRKTFNKTNGLLGLNCKSLYSQVLITVSLKTIDDIKDCNIVISMNGKTGLSFDEYAELIICIEEAKTVLTKVK